MVIVITTIENISGFNTPPHKSSFHNLSLYFSMMIWMFRSHTRQATHYRSRVHVGLPVAPRMLLPFTWRFNLCLPPFQIPLAWTVVAHGTVISFWFEQLILLHADFWVWVFKRGLFNWMPCCFHQILVQLDNVTCLVSSNVKQSCNWQYYSFTQFHFPVINKTKL